MHHSVRLKVLSVLSLLGPIFISTNHLIILIERGIHVWNNGASFSTIFYFACPWGSIGITCSFTPLAGIVSVRCFKSLLFYSMQKYGTKLFEPCSNASSIEILLVDLYYSIHLPLKKVLFVLTNIFLSKGL